MSDKVRKSFPDQVKEKLHPDSSKSSVDKTKESVTNTADRAAGELQPDSSKSGTQAGFDKSRREKDSVLDKAKHAMGMDKKN